MKQLQWIAIWSLTLAVTGCTAWDKYAAGENLKYSGSSLFTMYEEWGTPISRTRLITGGRFYQFRKQASGCAASAWTNDLDVIVRVTVAGPPACASGW